MQSSEDVPYILILKKSKSHTRTNIPTQWMAYSSYPFPSGVKSYPLHTEVLKYFESFADHFDLKRHIKFSHNVTRVVPIANKKWEISVKDLVNNVSETNIYDAVLVANGHFSVPNIPEIPGTSEFNGKIIHSHDFRDAEKYRGCIQFGNPTSSINL